MEHQQLTSTQSSHGFSDELNSSIARRVQFTDAKEEYEPCSDCSSGDETPSGGVKSSGRGVELSGETCSIGPD